MQILTDYEAFRPNPAQPLVLALGNFDGVHRGHQTLLEATRKSAKSYTRGMASVFTFQQHPQQVLHNDSGPMLLTDTDYKLYLLNACGIDICFLIPFTQTFSELSAYRFVEDILVRRLHVRKVLLGYNAHFGHNREGNAKLMQQLSSKYGFDFEEMPPVKCAGEFISSTHIRLALQQGNLEEAKMYLGRPYTVLGMVVEGSGRGRKLGFPTANMEIQAEIYPPTGVYAIKARMVSLERNVRTDRKGYELITEPDQKWQEGVLNFGFRPTFEEKAKHPTIEVHLFNFKGDLYGKVLEIAFYHKLRDEKKFASPELLKQQIEQDRQQAKDYFFNRNKNS